MNETVVNNIKMIMESKGLTPSTMAHLGISAPQMYYLLKHGNPTLKTLEKLSIALECDIREFFKEE